MAGRRRFWRPRYWVILGSVGVVGLCIWWGSRQDGFDINLASEFVGIGAEIFTGLIIVEWYLEAREREKWRGTTRLNYRLLAGWLQQVFLTLAIWISREKFTPDAEIRAREWLKPLTDDWPGFAAISGTCREIARYVEEHVWAAEPSHEATDREVELWHEIEPELREVDHLTDRIASYAQSEETVEALVKLAESRRLVQARVREHRYLKAEKIAPELRRFVRTASAALEALAQAARE